MSDLEFWIAYVAVWAVVVVGVPLIAVANLPEPEGRPMIDPRPALAFAAVSILGGSAWYLVLAFVDFWAEHRYAPQRRALRKWLLSLTRGPLRDDRPQLPPDTRRGDPSRLERVWRR